MEAGLLSEACVSGCLVSQPTPPCYYAWTHYCYFPDESKLSSVITTKRVAQPPTNAFAFTWCDVALPMTHEPHFLVPASCLLHVYSLVFQIIHPTLNIKTETQPNKRIDKDVFWRGGVPSQNSDAFFSRLHKLQLSPYVPSYPRVCFHALPNSAFPLKFHYHVKYIQDSLGSCTVLLYRWQLSFNGVIHSCFERENFYLLDWVCGLQTFTSSRKHG